MESDEYEYCFLDYLEDMMNDCRYCIWRKKCKNAGERKPIVDRDCPMRYKKRKNGK